MRAAYFVLLIALIPTWLISYRVWRNAKARDSARFERIVEDGRNAIEQRVGDHLDDLHAVRGLFAASRWVGQDEWSNYLQNIDLPHRHPGVRFIGYSEKVPAAEMEKFIGERRADGGSDYDIEPAGQRAVYYPIVYLTRFDSRGWGSVGYDLASRPELLEALDRASAKGDAAAAQANVSATSDSKGAGVVIFLPLYRNGTPVVTRAERNNALRGFVFSAFQPSELLKNLFGPQSPPMVEVEVFEGPQTASEALMYRSAGIRGEQSQVARADFSRTISLPVLDQTWTVRFSTLPHFAAESNYYLAWLSLLGGLMVSCLFFGITWVEVNARSEAERSAGQLQRSELALAMEKELLAVTLQSIADGVVTTDTEGKIISWNKAAARLLGTAQTNLAGRPSTEVFRIFHEVSREPYPSPVEKALHSGDVAEPQDLAILAAADGADRIITSSAAPIRDRTGRILGAVLVFRDMTERRKTEEEMLKESKLESVGLLAGGIAHDFNNILTGIIGNISLARMSAHSTEKMLERLMGVERSAIRARDLTQQLLTFAKGGSPIRRPIQLPSLVKDACQFALHGSNVQCEYSLPSDAWSVEADEGQFRSILSHLVINAKQSMPAGGKIEVKLENVELTAGFLAPLPAGKYVRISIKDHGSGIAPEHLARLFEPYFTTKKGGSGLGLATAYSVVRKHDGQMRVESTAGAGTTFSIYLPAIQTPTPPPAVSNQAEFLGHGRLLVMDDEPDILAIAGDMLRAFGFEVETARDGAEAIELYVAARDAGKPFEAVIMDLTVPNGMGGREAIRGLRELDPDVKAVVSSGYSFDPVMANYHQYGFCGIIPKPYRAEDLGRVLEEVLAKGEAGKLK